MMYATRIKMKPGCYSSQSLTEIDQIYIIGCDRPGYYKMNIPPRQCTKTGRIEHRFR